MNIVGWLIPLLIIIGAIVILRFAHLNKLSWKFILPAIVIPNLPVAVWDYFFTDWGIWQVVGDNEFFIFSFYISISLLALATYGLVKQRFTKSLMGNKDWLAAVVIFVILIALWITNIKVTFLSVPALFSAFMVLVTFIFFRNKYTENFIKTYMVLIGPFIIIKQIQVSSGYLSYGADMMSGVKIIDVPVEELIVLFCVTLLTVGLYEYVSNRFKKKPTDQ